MEHLLEVQKENFVKVIVTFIEHISCTDQRARAYARDIKGDLDLSKGAARRPPPCLEQVLAQQHKMGWSRAALGVSRSRASRP